MVRHTQTIRPQQPMNYLSVFDHFMGLVFKGLRQSALQTNYDRPYCLRNSRLEVLPMVSDVELTLFTGVFRTPSNTYDGAFCKNYRPLKTLAVNIIYL